MAWISAFGVTSSCTYDICLALSEACSNVVEHAAANDDYEVRLRVDDEVCAISIKNLGGGFDAAGLSGVMPAVDSARGRGVAIMRALMDHVAFESEPATGTIVHLVKALDTVPSGPMARLRRAARAGHESRSAVPT